MVPRVGVKQQRVIIMTTAITSNDDERVSSLAGTVLFD